MRVDGPGGNEQRRARQKAWRDFAGMHTTAFTSNSDLPKFLLFLLGSGFVLAGVLFITRDAIGFGLLMLLAGLVSIALTRRVRLWMNELRRQAIRSLEICIGFCPACDYDMRGLPREVDQCTVCPECGGAWRQDELPIIEVL